MPQQRLELLVGQLCLGVLALLHFALTHCPLLMVQQTKY
jgi:hypothetical protein